MIFAYRRYGMLEIGGGGEKKERKKVVIHDEKILITDAVAHKFPGSCDTCGGRQPPYLPSGAAASLTDVSKYKSRGNMNDSLD